MAKTVNPEPKLKPLKEMHLDLNDIRAAIVEQIRDGKREMDLESFFLLVHKVYKNANR